MKIKPLEILVTNDDGVAAKGINTVAHYMRKWGNVTVVAPASSQSGKSGSISLSVPVYLNKLEEEDGFRIFSLTGSPVDCVKMGIRILRNEGKNADLLISGINHGSNTSAASVYSGTLGAATEGCLYDVPSIGLSLNTHDENPDFSAALKYTDRILGKYFENGLPRGTYLNVNIPAVPENEIKGVRIAHQGAGRWVREYEAEMEPDGKEHFVMKGMFEDMEQTYTSGADMQGDHRVLLDNYVSIVPHKIDTTNYEEALRLIELWKCDTI